MNANRNKTLRAAVYCRISKDKTGQRAGVARQERECRETANRLGWRVIDVYVDNDISAYSGRRRPNYERLIADIESGAVNAVIAWHPDRLHRSPQELERFIDICDTHKVHNHTVQTGLWDLSTSSGRMTARVIGSVARYESEHKSERVKAAKKDAALRGAPQGGVRCFGYAGGPAKDGGGTKIIKSEAAEIRRLADAVIRGQSLRSLALELNERRIPTVTGKRWSSQHLSKMLLRPRLAGLRQHRGKVIGEGAWPAIITVETHEALKAVLLDPARRCGTAGGRRGPVPTALGTGIYVCGACGQPRLRLGRVGPGRKSVYRCGNAMTDHTSHVARGAERLDEYVKGALLNIISEPGVIEAICSFVDTKDADLAEMQREQTTIRVRLNNAAKRYETGDIDDEQLAIISSGLHKRDAEITAALMAGSRRSALDVLLGEESIEQAWDEVLTMGQKRAILSEMLVVTVLPGAPGRAPDGSYFNPAGIRIELTEHAASAAA